MSNKVSKTDHEWKQELSPEQYRVLREKGTERAFTGEYDKSKVDATYRCAGCGTELFRSDEKFDSGSGWPSFYAPADSEHVKTETDRSFLMKRTGPPDSIPTCAPTAGYSPLAGSSLSAAELMQ